MSEYGADDVRDADGRIDRLCVALRPGGGRHASRMAWCLCGWGLGTAFLAVNESPLLEAALLGVVIGWSTILVCGLVAEWLAPFMLRFSHPPLGLSSEARIVCVGAYFIPAAALAGYMVWAVPVRMERDRLRADFVQAAERRVGPVRDVTIMGDREQRIVCGQYGRVINRAQRVVCLQIDDRGAVIGRAQSRMPMSSSIEAEGPFIPPGTATVCRGTMRDPDVTFGGCADVLDQEAADESLGAGLSSGGLGNGGLGDGGLDAP